MKNNILSRIFGGIGNKGGQTEENKSAEPKENKMGFNILNSIYKGIGNYFKNENKKIDLDEAIKNSGMSNKSKNKSAENKIKSDPYNNKIDVTNAHSWNRETHPNGYEPSFLVKDIHYDNTDGDGKLDVTYRDGFTAEYDRISPSQAVDFHNADSKGRWALKNLWKLPYKSV